MAAAPPDGRGARRLASIDALRAIAALLVLVTHATERFADDVGAVARATFLYRLSHALDFGRIGVILFFLVSGYVIAGTLADPRTTVRDFLVRRFFRLYPLYWASIALAIAFFFHGAGGAGRLAANATMLPTIFGEERYLGLYWTLETELVFYGLALALLAAGVLQSARALAALAAALIVAFAAIMFGVLPAPQDLSWKSLPLNLAFMVVGVMARAREGDVPRGTAPWLVACVAAALAPSAFTFARYLSTGGADDLRWGVAYPAAVAIFFALLHAPRLPLAALARFGVVSYSAYLLHPFALALVDRVVPAATLFSAAGMAGAVAVSIAATAAIAFATYALVEAPFNRMARRLTGPRTSEEASHAAP